MFSKRVVNGWKKNQENPENPVNNRSVFFLNKTGVSRTDGVISEQGKLL